MVGWLLLCMVGLAWGLHWRRTRRRLQQSLRGPHVWLSGCLLALLATLPELWCAWYVDTTDAFGQSNLSRRWFKRHVWPNEAGYRDGREFPQERADDVQYWVFVGDSFAFGHGLERLEDRMTERLEAELKRRYPECHIQVYNAALPGMEIRAIVEGVIPDLLQRMPIDTLWYVFVPNDLEFYDDRTAEFYRRLQRREPRFWLWRYTYFYNWLYHRWQGVLARGEFDYYGYLAEAATGEAWEHFDHKLNELWQLTSARGMTLHFVIFPLLTTLGMESDPFAPLYERVITWCRLHDVACIDLRESLRPHLTEGLMLHAFDPHPNQRAHALAAQALLHRVEPPCGDREP
ncbi:MAG: hypothetical protein KatS3mg113_0104 [Planctomycetaceae bacterium]|nr:MAG: hypothetical protein KatS3mg113_0104 [Planctomycetaceae bacterium]